MGKTPLISFVIPAYNEAESLLILINKIKTNATKLKKYKYEIIIIDDGSTDNTLSVVKKLSSKNNKKVKIVTHRANFGKSRALRSGFNTAKGEIIITMDADLQDDPREIKKFIKKIEEGYDLVSGWKRVRHDPKSKVWPSRFFNYATNKLTGIELHDINCGFKAYRKEALDSLPLYGELYRFIPVFVHKNGFKITEIEVKHNKRKYGRSKYGVGRNIKGLLDLFTIVFITGFIKRPGHFFGTIGLTSFGSGFIIGIYISYLRITTGTIQNRHPLLQLGILLIVVGIQLITTGLLAELIVYFNYLKNEDLSR